MQEWFISKIRFPKNPNFQKMKTFDILREMMPSGTATHVIHQWALSVIGQCFYYRANAKILTMLIEEEELRSEFTIDQLSVHITNVILRGLGYCPPLSSESAVAAMRRGR